MATRKMNLKLLETDHNLVHVWEHFPDTAELPLGVFMAVDDSRPSNEGKYAIYRRALISGSKGGISRSSLKTILLGYFVERTFARRASLCIAAMLNEPCSLVPGDHFSVS